MAAHKMRGDTRNFLRTIEQRYTTKLEAAASGTKPGFVALHAPMTIVNGSFSEVDFGLLPLPGSDKNSIISLITNGHLDPSKPYSTMIESGWQPSSCELWFNNSVPFY